MCNAIINDKYPKIRIDYKNKTYNTVTYTQKITIDEDTFRHFDIQGLYNIGIRKLRAVVVYPKFTDKRSIAQGILCPTVFNYYSRMTNAHFA